MKNIQLACDLIVCQIIELLQGYNFEHSKSINCKMLDVEINKLPESFFTTGALGRYSGQIKDKIETLVNQLKAHAYGKTIKVCSIAPLKAAKQYIARYKNFTLSGIHYYDPMNEQDILKITVAVACEEEIMP